MLNWQPDSITEYRDVQTIWNYEHTALDKTPEQRLQRLWRSSRDNARTPVQWSDEEHAGFTTGQPWMSVNPNYTKINAKQQEEDPDSILNLYRKAIALRKSLPVVRDGKYQEFWKLSSNIYMYSRETSNQKLLVVCSFSEKQIPLLPPKGYDIEKAQLILQNVENDSTSLLKPYESRVYLWEK